ncbi:ankyrin repeat domain-containing protein [Xanthocytophaga agilis]|uniref:Ankyrin repeat domain-containing protein n=1 Tax=Xanthocytophaga agilis TaxID=3048010 RepID=A0AAE3UDH6_9BACT|nr:ankyrin repeat domain-containing protein [Xanthocytophaga agilis]MDJ1501240.1 ankyrin repeat domain-containing protein [Xanthocytophaga agilis]
MAKKRKTLPKNFEELLSTGDLQALKAVFTTCEPDARGGYAKATALDFDNCPHELAVWLVQQGAYLQATDTWGNTPLHNRSRSVHGNIKSLLTLGAYVHAKNNHKDTPLHTAASAHNVENTELLLAYGAYIHALNSDGNTPLEQALQMCRNAYIVNTVKLAKIYLQAGVQITPKMKGFVHAIGKQFEFYRAGFNQEYVEEVSAALEELYQLFDVEPVAKRILHDGKSPITTTTQTWQQQHTELWNLLVPSSGPAATLQGEVIRITGRIANEVQGNGGINWDSEYKKMADAFLAFIKEGNPLSSSEIVEAQELVRKIKRRSGDTSRLCELGVQWVTNNPLPLILSHVEYNR